MSRTSILVFDLDADNRTAVFEEQAVKLPGDFTVENFHFSEVVGIIGTYLPAFFENPVGQTAVADLAMTPRAATNNRLQTDLARCLDKLSQVPAA